MSSDKPNYLPVVTVSLIAISVVWASYILGGSFVRARADTDTIRVTGSARKEIKSDFVIWKTRVGYRGTDVAQTYASLKAASDRAVAYLVEKGLKADEIKAQAVQTKTLYASSPDGKQYESYDTYRNVAGYELSQVIEVTSKDVDKVESVSRTVTELISSGVALEAEPPMYVFTKIGDVKVEILAEAAKDARRRAEEIAKSSGGGLTGVRSARMSPLQISPVYDYQIMGDGQNDTTSREKAVTAIVTMTFGVR